MPHSFIVDSTFSLSIYTLDVLTFVVKSSSISSPEMAFLASLSAKSLYLSPE